MGGQQVKDHRSQRDQVGAPGGAGRPGGGDPGRQIRQRVEHPLEVGDHRTQHLGRRDHPGHGASPAGPAIPGGPAGWLSLTGSEGLGRSGGVGLVGATGPPAAVGAAPGGPGRWSRPVGSSQIADSSPAAAAAYIRIRSRSSRAVSSRTWDSARSLARAAAPRPIAPASGWRPEGRYRLGRWGWPVTIVAVVYLALMLVNVVLPSGLSSPRAYFNID